MILNNDCIWLLSLFYGIPCALSQQPQTQLNKRYSFAVEQIINPYHLLGPLKRSKELAEFPALDHTASKNENKENIQDTTDIEDDFKDITDQEDNIPEFENKEVSASPAKRFPSNSMSDPWTDRLFEDKFSNMDKRYIRMPREFMQSLKDDGLIPVEKRFTSFRMSKENLIKSLKSQGLYPVKRLAAEKRFGSFRMKPQDLLQSLRDEGLLPPPKRFTSFRMPPHDLLQKLKDSGPLALNKRFTSFRMSKQDLVASLKAKGIYPGKRSLGKMPFSPFSYQRGLMMSNDDFLKGAEEKRFTSFRFRPEFMNKDGNGEIDNQQELEKRPKFDEIEEVAEPKSDAAKVFFYLKKNHNSKVRARLARYLQDKGYRSSINEETDSSVEEPLALASSIYRQPSKIPTSRGQASFFPTYNREQSNLPSPSYPSRQLSFLPTSSRIMLGNREVQDDGKEENNNEDRYGSHQEEVDNDAATLARLSRPFPLVKNPEESSIFPGIPAYYHNALFG